MIPLWKLRREILRVLRQAVNLPVSLVALLVSTPYYDVFLARKRKIFDGSLPDRDRIAIFVIFPRNGVADSHLRTIEHLFEKGYAPLVVSNLPLGSTDREKVLARCWRLIERPNYGYDFGGYRDGVLFIADRLSQLQRLVFLNDSCWFPLPNSDDWLAKAAALDADYVGAATNYAVDPPDIGELGQIAWDFDTNRYNFHYCSFALSLSARIVSDPRFRLFWKRFRLSNEKSRVVRRGEIGLTRWTLRRGYSHAAVYDARRLDEVLHAMPLDDLSHLLARLMVPGDPRLLVFKNDILRDMQLNGIDRDRLERLALLVIARQGMSYALADYLITKFRFPFLKKSPLWLDDESSRISLKIIEELGADADYILREARELVPDRAL